MPASPLKKPPSDAAAVAGVNTRRAGDNEKECPICDNLLKGIRDGLVFHDAFGRIRRINNVMETLLGVTDADARGKTLKEAGAEQDICLLITARPPGNGDVHSLRGREYEVTSTDVKDPDGRPGGTITVFHDVTEKCRLDRQRTEFLSMITHDLKAPLTTILGFSGLILEGSMGEVGDDIREAVAAMDQSGKKLLSLIDDFLTISKLDAGLMAPELAPLDAGELATSVVEGFRPKADLAGRGIAIEVMPGVAAVMGDERQLERALTNLLDNAVKFTRDGGSIKVSVSMTSPDQLASELGADYCNLTPHVEIVVQDDGIGIAGADLPHIFDRYWRGQHDSGIKGTGLGLAIVKSIVDAHSGTVRVKSEPGKGSHFYIWLPAIAG